MMLRDGFVTSPSHSVRFPIASRTVEVKGSVSPISSQIMSRKTSAIVHRLPSFRFRRGDTTGPETEEAARKRNYNPPIRALLRAHKCVIQSGTVALLSQICQQRWPGTVKKKKCGEF